VELICKRKVHPYLFSPSLIGRDLSGYTGIL
jgi:hypothetical protein